MNSVYESDQVELRTVLQLTRKHWLVASCWMLLVAVAVVYITLQMPNQYKSVGTLLANEPSGKAGGLSGALGSVGALAGLSLGGGAEKKSVVAIELMKSRHFFAAFMQKYQLKLPLMAANGWDPATGKLSYDPDIYDEKSQTWVRKAMDLRQAEPSAQEAYEEFMRRFSVTQDKLTSVVTVSLEFLSPELAQRWLQLYIDEVNLQMRMRDIADAESSIKFIEERISQTVLNEVRETLYSLLEEHNKTLVFANIRPDYVFKAIDPPSKPDLKSGPVRSLIVLATLLVAALLFLLAIVIRLVWQSTNQNANTRKD